MTRWATWRTVVLAATVAATAVVSDAADWEPVSLVVALTAALVAADVSSVASRRIRMDTTYATGPRRSRVVLPALATTG